MGLACLVGGLMLCVLALVFAFALNHSMGEGYSIAFGAMGGLFSCIGLCCCCCGKETTVFDRNLNEFFRQRVSFYRVTDRVNQRLSNMCGI